jgi:hypothetical protein
MEQAVKKFIEATDFTFIPGEKMKVHIFKVKPTDEAVIHLLETGFFDGTEKFIRLTQTKGSSGKWSFSVYTIVQNDGNSWSKEFGSDGWTLMSEKNREMLRIVDRAIDLLLN